MIRIPKDATRDFQIAEGLLRTARREVGGQRTAGRSCCTPSVDLFWIGD